jgi:chromosome segregation ATPase
MSKVTVREAALLTGKSRETINTATKDGTISYTHNEKNHKVIDISELQRVYPIVKPMAEIEQSDSVKSGQNRTVSSQSDLEKEVAVLKERLDGLTREKDHLTEERVRERRQLESEIDNLRSSLEWAQDQHNKAMLLLTDQRQSEEKRGLVENERDRKLDALEQKIKELRSQNKRIFRHSQEQKKKLEELQNESWWKRLLG